MSTIDVRPMIIREMNKQLIRNVDIARKLQNNPASIQGMLNRPTMQVNKLVALSDIFQYNFFREIAAKISYPEPNYSVKPDTTEIEALQTKFKDLEIHAKDLEIQVKTLMQVIKDLKVK